MMGQINKFQKLLHLYRPLSYYIIGIILALPLYTILKTSLISNNSILLSGYAAFLIYLSKTIISILGFSGFLDGAIFPETFRLGVRSMAIWQTIIFVVGLLLLPFKYSKKFFLLIIGLSGIVAFNVLRIVIIRLNNSVWHFCATAIVNNVFVIILNVVFVFLLLEWFKNNYSLRKLLLERIKVSPLRLRSIVNKVIWALFMIILINFITNTQFIPFVSYLVSGILTTSEIILHYFGYAAEVINNKSIIGINANVYFRHACLGLELMMTFAAFIIILDGRVWNKIWYITLGLVIIYLLNIARITIIFMHLANNHGNYKLSINYHDIFTYPVYVVVFIMWVIWINRFNRNPDKL